MSGPEAVGRERCLTFEEKFCRCSVSSLDEKISSNDVFGSRTLYIQNRCACRFKCSPQQTGCEAS